MTLSVQAQQRSFVGGRSRNEDCVGLERNGEQWCLVLSDGAGGHQDGAVAARLVVDRVLSGFRARPPADGEDLAELIHDAHEAVVAAQRANGAVGGGVRAMHATVVVLTIDPRGASALWGHVGDSRLYVLRRGALLTVTRDDSIVQWMVEAGYLDPARSREHPQKNRLLAAIGADGELAPHVPAVSFPIEDGDAFLLCSDGWWDCVEPADLERLLAESGSVGAWIDAMAAQVAAHAKLDHDNYSAVACWIGDPAQATRIVPVRAAASIEPGAAPNPSPAPAPTPAPGSARDVPPRTPLT